MFPSLFFILHFLFFCHQSGICFVRGIVREVQKERIVLSDGTEVPFGILVWSTGVGPSEFVESLNLPKCPGGRYISLPGSELVMLLPSYEDCNSYSNLE